MRTQTTAQAFLDKGAKAFVGWSDSVSADHTDASTQYLLEELFTQGLSVREAVDRTATKVGSDPWFGGELEVVLREG